MTESTVTSQTTLIHGLYAIADSAYLTPENIVAQVAAAIEGGARVVQYRDKHSPPATRLSLALSLVALCRERAVPLIINDDVQLTLDSGADGVHLGQHDGDVHTARQRLGDNALVGVSCYNEWERAQRAQEEGADYIAFGRFFPSHTKPNAAPAEIDLLLQARTELSLPIVAIGGITPKNGASLVTAGAHALAVIEGLWGPGDARAAAALYAQLFH